MSKVVNIYSCFGLLWYEWLVIILMPGGSAGEGTFVYVFTSAFLLSALAAFALCSASMKRRRSLIIPFWVVVVCAFILSLSKLYTCFGQRLIGFSPQIIPLYTIFSSGAFIVLFYAFCQLMNDEHLPEIRRVLFRSQIVGMGAYVVLMFICNASIVVFGIVEMTFPFFVALAIRWLRLRQQSDDHIREVMRDSVSEKATRQSLRNVSLMMVLYAALAGLLISRAPSILLPEGRVETAMLILVVLLAGAAYLRGHSLVSKVFEMGRAGMVLSIVGIIVMLSQGTLESISYSLIMAGYFLFYTSMFVYYVTLSRFSKRLRTGEVLSFAMGVDCLGLTAGVLVSTLIVQVAPDSFMDFMAAIATLLLVMSEFALNKRTLFQVSNPVSEPLEIDNEQIRITCIQLGQNYQLTKRQQEIFELLAFGHRVNDIAKILCISAATVRTHTHFIYEKLGVHSNAELRDRVRSSAQML